MTYMLHHCHFRQLLIFNTLVRPTVIHARGSPETLRDHRGFVVKFYTREVPVEEAAHCLIVNDRMQCIFLGLLKTK
ncbi:hypothetical protein FRX31_020979, partial [Thalictrum thalictroides]